MNTTAIPLLSKLDELRCCRPFMDEPGLGALSTPRGNLPLKLLHVEARVVGLMATTQLRQTYVNTLGAPLEATYIFPLPDRAAVTRFRLEVGERVVEGVVQERGQARATYDRAISDGHRAAIAEEERPGVFTIRVGNLLPGDEATVWLDLVGPVPFADGEATYQLPLVVSQRYIPGAALPGESVGSGTALDTDAVPDASRISPPVLLPGFPSPVRLSIEIEVDGGGLAVSDVRASLHAVSVTPTRSGATRVRLAPGDKLDRDFIVRFKLGHPSNELRPSLVIRPDAPGEPRGTFMLTLAPPADAARGRRPKDVVILLDRSGSMGGWKMVAARRATARLVDTLSEHDWFEVLAFDDQVELMSGSFEPATDRVRFKAVERLAKLEARGGTELARPLARACELLLDDDRPDRAERDKVIVLITDGQVGNEDQLLRTLGEKAARLRVFTLGIDQAVNAAFLRRVAAVGGGACELVESEDRLDEVMAKVHRRIDAPVLSGLRLIGDGLTLEPDTLVPARHQDVFPGAPLVVLGRCSGAGSITVEATDATGAPWRTRLEASRDDAAPLGVAWARGHLRQLEDRYVTSDDPRARAELERQLLGTSLTWGVLCRFTAFVAVDRAAVVNRGGNVHRVTQAVESTERQAERKKASPGAAAPRSRKASGLAGYAPSAPDPFGGDPFGGDPFGAAPPVGGMAPGAAPARGLARFDDAADPFAAVAGGMVPSGGEDEDGFFGELLEDRGPPAAPPARNPGSAAFARPSAGAPADSSVSVTWGAPVSVPNNPLAGKPLGAPPPAKAPAPAAAGAPMAPRASASGRTGSARSMKAPPSPPKAEPARPGQPGEDPVVAAYRRRAEPLVALVTAQVTASDQRRRELGRLLLLVEQLLEDLRSVGGPLNLVRPLEGLVRDLVVLRGQSLVAEAEVQRLWERASELLLDFVKGGPLTSGSAAAAPVAPPPATGRSFWK